MGKGYHGICEQRWLRLACASYAQAAQSLSCSCTSFMDFKEKQAQTIALAKLEKFESSLVAVTINHPLRVAWLSYRSQIKYNLSTKVASRTN